MNQFLLIVSVLFALIVVVGFINDRITHLTYEIALLLFSVVIGCIFTAVYAMARGYAISDFLNSVQVFNLERFLMQGVLCFMLFAGARNLKIGDFKKNASKISILAFVCTLLGALFYGALFYLVCVLLHIDFSIPMCLMLGSIVAPTDPIAATSILKKFGLPEKIGFLMETESLLNDGVGVALFVLFSGMTIGGEGVGFFAVMAREILGAVIVGLVVSWICFQFFIHIENMPRKIISTLLMVSLSYFICEEIECSGAIACVVCGVCFSTYREAAEKKGRLKDLEEFDSFWETIDVLLNSVLYVMLGLTFVRILQMPMVLILSLSAILLNLVCRYASVYSGTLMMGQLPDGYNRSQFSALFTWGGLRGGLSIALAMSTASIVTETQYHVILGCAYAIVFFTMVVQGLTMNRVYQSIKAKIK